MKKERKPKITTIILDVGGVQYFYDHMKAAKAMEKEIGIPAKKIFKALAEKASRNSFVAKAELGSSEKEYWKQFSRELNIDPVNSKKMSRLWNKIFSPNTQMLELIKKLSKKYKIGLLSNMSQGHKKWLLSKGVAKPFKKNHIIWSCDINVRKPDKRIYTLALKKLGSKPNETIFVDDFPRNIKAAKKVGEYGIVYKNHKAFLKKLKKFGIEG